MALARSEPKLAIERLLALYRTMSLIRLVELEIDLVAATLGPTAEAANIVTDRGVKAARLQAILAEVAQRFSDPNFDLNNVAGALGMSRRYVQKLLEGTGKSFTEHLAGCRLERAFAMLTDPHHLHLAIIDIAFAVGFGDVSHFNRMFRRY